MKANQWIDAWRAADQAGRMFAILAFVTLLSLYAGVATGWYASALAPVLLVGAYLAVVNFKLIFWLLIFCLPLSTEVELPGGFGTDLPTEPLIVGLMLIFFLQLAHVVKHYPGGFVRHPITLLLFLHLAWIFTTALLSDLFVVSLKFSLAKIWYVVTFYFLAGQLLREEADFRKLFWVAFWPMLFVVIVVMIRHGAHGFSFADVHKVLHPFQRNHVNYAATLTLFFPFIVAAWQWFPHRSKKWWFMAACALLFLAAIYLSYTRAAYIALIIALGAYFVIRWRLVGYVLILSLIGAIAGAVYVVQDNRYLDYAPNYDRTISHESFDNLIEATYKMEDISTMERLYRWVAGGQMMPYRPWKGWGPGNFVNFYRSYTVLSFRTYVSNNQENSGIHSYYLMTLVEQGIPGLFLLLLLLGYTLLRGQQIYHQLTGRPGRQQIVMVALLSLVIIDAFLLINDLIETDKVGSFFFINMALLVNQELALRTPGSDLR